MAVEENMIIESDEDMDSLHPTPKYVSMGARNNTSPSSVLFNASAINNMTSTLCEYITEQDVDLPCVTETWRRDGKSVDLKDLSLQSYSVSSNHEQKAGEVCNTHLWVFLHSDTPCTKDSRH